MDRRTLIGMLAGSLLVAPLAGRAQPAPKLSRIGYISLRPGPNEFDQAFLRGMRERGWVEGQNLAIDFRWAALDRSRMQPLVTELLALQPALMVCTDGAVGAVRSQNPAMPIVHPAFGDAIKGGFTTSLSRPDGNVTGSSVLAIELAFKRIELLKEAVPGLRRVAAFYTAGADPPKMGIQASIAAGKELSIEVVEMPVRLPEGIDAAFAAATRQGVQGVSIISSLPTITYRAQLGELARTHRLATIFANRSYLRGGGLMSYGPDLEGAFHRAAYFVDRILKGAKPVDLPIEQPSTFQLALHQGTARSLGLRFPQSLMVRADEVIQ
jgi:putative ABC transport system substrate-binding protein